MIYGNFSLKKNLISKGISSTLSVQHEKMASVTHCDYSEKNGLVEKILIVISILEMFPNPHPNPVLN
jgi:hypothetical protein